MWRGVFLFRILVWMEEGEVEDGWNGECIPLRLRCDSVDILYEYPR